MVKPANLWQLAKNTGTYAELIVYIDSRPYSCHLHDSEGIAAGGFEQRGSLRLSQNLDPVYALINSKVPVNLRPPQSRGTVVARYNGSTPYVEMSDHLEFSKGEPVSSEGIERILGTEYSVMLVS